jgi:hypothetical protein
VSLHCRLLRKNRRIEEEEAVRSRVCDVRWLLVIDNYPDGVDDPREVAQECEQEADPELDLAADLEEDAEGRQDDGDDEVHERRRPVGHRRRPVRHRRPIDHKHRQRRRKGGERMGGDETTRCQREQFTKFRGTQKPNPIAQSACQFLASY